MRREVRARWLAAVTAIVVVVLAALFAAMRNAYGAAPTDAVTIMRIATADYIFTYGPYHSNAAQVAFVPWRTI